MRKILSSFCFASLLAASFAITSCADNLNTNYPYSSSIFAHESGVNYTSETESSSYSDSVSGQFNYGYQEDIYYFTSASGENTYTISWKNTDSGTVAVSVSSYSSFSKCVSDFEDDTSSLHSIVVNRKMKVYIRVRPENGYTFNAGKYKLTVSGNSGNINLYKYN